MLEKQNYKCKICGNGEEEAGHELRVDHCHNTGKIRGLLCSQCNTALGLLKDNPDNIQKALEYIIESSSN